MVCCCQATSYCLNQCWSIYKTPWVKTPVLDYWQFYQRYRGHWEEARHGSLSRYVTLWVAHAPGMPGTFSQPPLVSDPDMHHGTCMMCNHLKWRNNQNKESKRERCATYIIYLLLCSIATGIWHNVFGIMLSAQTKVHSIMIYLVF